MLVALVALHLMAGPAWAQRPARLPGDDKGFMQWLIAVGITILVCIPAFMNPKRTHLD